MNNQLNNASTDTQKDTLKAQIEKITKDITKLEMTDPDKNGENEARRINGMEVIKTNPFKESDETKQPEDIKPKKDIIEEDVKAALERGQSAQNIIDNDLIPAVNKVGELFEQKKYYLHQKQEPQFRD